MKRGKLYFGILVGFLVFLLICTYAAGQIYQKNLPTVTVEDERAMILNYTYQAKGIFSYTQVSSVSLPVDCLVTESFASAEDFVKQGDLLLKVDLKDIRLGLYRLQMEREVMTQKSAAAQQSYEKEVFADNVGKLDKQMTELQLLLDANGAIYAPLSGCVVTCTETGSSVKEGQNLASIADTSGDKVISFTLDASAKYLSNQAFVTAYYTVGHTEKTMNLQLSDIDYRQQDNTYHCTAKVTGDDIGLVQGQIVSLSVGTASNTYLYVVPSAAIIADNTGNVQFYVLREKTSWRGKVFCVYLLSSLIKEENGLYTALASSAMDPVIISTDRPLSHGCEVKLAGS